MRVRHHSLHRQHHLLAMNKFFYISQTHKFAVQMNSDVKV